MFQFDSAVEAFIKSNTDFTTSKHWSSKYNLFVHLSFFFFNLFSKYLKKIIISNYSLNFYLKNSKFLVSLCFLLKNHTNTQCTNLVDICVIDYPNKEFRFELHYILLSVFYKTRIKIILFTNEFLSVHSLANIFLCSNWIEREVWDLFGIFFDNNLDLRRILTDYGFKGHPLRKDFPMTGYIELFYDDTQKRIKYSTVSLAQEYRIFKFQNPWRIL